MVQMVILKFRHNEFFVNLEAVHNNIAIYKKVIKTEESMQTASS